MKMQKWTKSGSRKRLERPNEAMPRSAAAPSWRSSLVTRLALLCAVLLAAVVGLSGFLIYRGSREHLIQIRREALRHDAERAAQTLRAAAAAAVHDLRFLSRAPTIRETVRQQRKPEEERWRTLAEGELRALLEGRPSYAQVRLAGGTAGESELICWFNRGGFLLKAARERIPLPAEIEDARAASALPPDEPYFAPLHADQMEGSAAPTAVIFRTATRITADHESVSALLALDLDLSQHFVEVAMEASPGARFEITYAESGGLLFASEAAGSATDDLRSARPPGGGLAASGASSDLQSELRFELLPGAGQELLLRATLPATDAFAGLEAIRARVLSGTALAVALAFALVVLVASVPARRLRRVAEAVSRYEAGEPLQALPRAGRDEVGVLVQSFRQMADKVRSQVAALETAREAAEAATREKEEFLAIISHEIRTPLNSVFGLLRVLERSRPAPHQAPVLASLRAAAKHLLSLLNDALDFAKFSAGKLDFEQADFALGELLGELAITHRPLAMQKGIAFELDLAPALPAVVNGDSVRLAQILNNLVSNALKFTEAGYVRVRVRPEESPGSGQVRIRFEVEDTGSGIAPEDCERVFAPFMRARGAQVRRIEGTGLGLHIVRTLAQMQGGEVSLTSTLGEGSRFAVLLPFRTAAAAAVDAGGAPAPALRGWRVLYAEDIASNREVMAAILEETGAALVSAETGADALGAAAAQAFTIALVDLQLQDMTGIELARRLREQHPELPILAVTAQCSVKAAEECRAVGIAAVVTKPVDPAKLLQAMLRAGAPARSPDSSATALDDIFRSDPVRHRRVLLAIAQEMREARDTLRSAFSTGDVEAMRATRHKLHSAIEQLGLGELRAALDSAITGNTDANGLCLALLEAAAGSLDTRAEALT